MPRKSAARQITLVTVADFVPLFRRPLQTVRLWPHTFRLTPIAHVSDTDVYDLGDVLRRVDRESDPAAAEEIRARATIQGPAVVCGTMEVAQVCGKARQQGSTWAHRQSIGTPAAVLRPAKKPDGTPARQIRIWLVEQLTGLDGYDAGRAAQLAETNTVR